MSVCVTESGSLCVRVILRWMVWQMGTMEMILATSYNGIAYALLSGQPLTIIGRYENAAPHNPRRIYHA